MAEAVLYAIILGAISGATGQQVEVEPEVFSYPGQTVNLRCALINSAGNELTQVTWSYESKEGNRINIAVFHLNFDPSYPDSPVKGRVSFSPSPPNLNSPSIQIRDVRVTDEGNYICSIFTFPAGNRQGTTSLVILEEVGKVTVTASSTDLVEFSSVSLFCFVSSGSSLSFLWLNGSSEVTASDRVQLTDGNTTLTIVSVTRYDQGPFRCHVFNAVSNGTSAPVNLSISFGPENIHLTKSPSQDYYVEGSDIILMCSAVSRPTALFNWFLNRVPLSDTGRELRLINIKEDQSGNYSCQAFNNKTMRNETSQPSVISVLTRVSNVIITASSTDLVEFSSVSLFCSSSGSSLSFLWLNGSSEVTASDRVQLTDGNTTLTIVSVTRYDQGPFRCHVFNAVSNDTSAPVNLSISFGPENIHLTKSPSQDYYVEGSDISLMCSAVSRPAALFNWFLNRVPLSDTGRELRLINIKEDQSGNYSCQAFNNKTMRNETSQPSVISVLTRVSNVIVTASSTDLVEFSSVSLFCSSSGSSLSFLWLNGSSEVTASDRVQLTDGNSTLTIVSVTRYDQGPFRCHVFNPFSNDTSAPINLSISYGPENINLTLCPSQEYYVEGSDISLMCSAVSRPAALFNWFLNRVPLSDTGPELRLINIQESQSGNYSCQAFNNKTLSNQTSQPSVVSVLEPIVNASVTSSPNQPVEGNSVKLTCEAAGSVFARKWMKDGADLIQTGRVLSFQSLKKTDSGKCSCNISNPVSSVEAEYIMVVNYGPENVQIKGPSTISLNENLTLTCSAESTPTANFSWKLNETKILNNSAVLTKHITDLSDSGEYTCEAMNRITEKTSSAVHGLTVTQYQTVHPSCSTGCIVGIVIACCVVIVVCILLVLLYIKKKKKSPNRDTGTRTAGEGQNNAAYSGSQELNYADIRFFQNKNGGTVNLGLQNNTSEYAEVRVNNGLPAVSSPPTYDAHMQRRTAPAP